VKTVVPVTGQIGCGTSSTCLFGGATNLSTPVHLEEKNYHLASKYLLVLQIDVYKILVLVLI
jgi:hypothetical protein